jgi:uncharacterized protein YggE
MTEGILRVEATEKLEISASSARLHIRVEGDAFLFGNAVLERSREVRELVTRFKEMGVADADVSVQGVQAKLSQGVLARGSSATFNLVVTARDLTRLTDLIGALSAAKRAELTRLEWIFDADEAMVNLSAKAMLKAQKKAQAMASTVGYELTGIRSCADSSGLPETQTVYFNGGAADMSMMRMKAPASADIGTEFKATQEVFSSVTVEFTLSAPTPQV